MPGCGRGREVRFWLGVDEVIYVGMEELVEDVVKNGYQMSIHANGDQAINNTVRRYFLASLRFLSRQSEKHR